MHPHRPNLVDNGFIITIIVKCIGGIAELITGLGLIFISISTLQHYLAPLSHLGLVPHITSGVRLFAIVYFSIRGLVRVILAISLLREKLWAYPVTLVLLGVSVLYQLWLLVSGHFSGGLAGLTIFDAITVVLTWVEYGKLRRGGHLNALRRQPR